MAVIQPYEEQVAAQGGLNVRAIPDQFGANVGEALQNVGNATMTLADTLYRNEVENDVTNVHVQMAKKRAEYQQRLVEMQNSTQPGDDTFVPRVMDGIQKDLETFGGTVKTQKGQQLFARMSSDMTAMFGQEAIGIQSRLNGEFAKNQYRDLTSNFSSIAAQDHTQVQSLITQARAAIDDPDGRFAKVPEPTRQAFRRDAEEQIKYSAALGFSRRFPNAVLGEVPTELRDSVRRATANQPPPGLPPDLKASDVKPYDQKAIDSRARQVAQPSVYDDVFQKAANLYNLDWRELKMRAVVESNLNPTAVSNKNAGGIMQFTPEMAAQSGVDRNNPTASIFAAAKLISQYRVKAGGDMSKVDMMYYGGESGKAWGPNTKQYAANLAALRQTVGLGSAVAPEAFAPDSGSQTAATQDWKKPRTGIDFIDTLPADKFFSVLAEAEKYQRAYDAQSERARIEERYQQQVAQEATKNVFVQRIFNPNNENGGSPTEIQIASDSVLTSDQKTWLINVLGQRARELQSGNQSRSNAEKVREFVLAIKDERILNDTPLYEAYSKGQINTGELDYLVARVNGMKDPSQKPFMRQVQTIEGQVWRAIQGNPVIQGREAMSPGLSANIAYEFSFDLQNKIQELRKQNKNPDILFDPSSPDYVLKPGFLQKYLGDRSAALPTTPLASQGQQPAPGAAMPQAQPAQARPAEQRQAVPVSPVRLPTQAQSNTVSINSLLESAAQQPAQTQPRAAAQPATATLPTYKDFDKLPKGTAFTDPQGNVRVKP